MAQFENNLYLTSVQTKTSDLVDTVLWIFYINKQPLLSFPATSTHPTFKTTILLYIQFVARLSM